MPRRRMISPEFWKDSDIRKLTREERLFFIGCVSHADDDGRLMAHPAYLKAMIFMYDDDLTLEGVKKLRDSMLSKVRNLVLYTNGSEEYLAFSKWRKHQKPSRPTPSDLPPPQFSETNTEPHNERITETHTERLSETNTETHNERITETPRASIVKVSLVKDSIGKDSIVQEDFTKFLDNEKDLTDFMTTTLTKYMPSGPPQVMEVVKKFWLQATGRQFPGNLFDPIFTSLKKYSIPVLAISLVKAARYSPGKTKPANYVLAIFEKQAEEERNRSP